MMATWRPVPANARLNPGHPLVQGLDIRGFWVPTQAGPILRDLSGNGVDADSWDGAATVGLTDRGLALRLTGAGQRVRLANTDIVDSQLKIPRPFTFIARIRPRGLSDVPIWCNNNAGPYLGFFVTIGRFSTAKLEFGRGDGDGTGPGAREIGLGATSLQAGQAYDIAGVLRDPDIGATCSIYLDGAEDFDSITGNANSSAPEADYDTGPGYFGDRPGGSSASGSPDFDLYYAMVIAGDLSQARINAIQADPYALIARPRRALRLAAPVGETGAIARPSGGVGIGAVGKPAVLLAPTISVAGLRMAGVAGAVTAGLHSTVHAFGIFAKGEVGAVSIAGIAETVPVVGTRATGGIGVAIVFAWRNQQAPAVAWAEETAASDPWTKISNPTGIWS